VHACTYAYVCIENFQAIDQLHIPLRKWKISLQPNQTNAQESFAVKLTLNTVWQKN